MDTGPTDRRSVLAAAVVLASGCLGDGQSDEESDHSNATETHQGYVSASNQEGDGSSVTITAASASVAYYLEVRYEGQSTVSETYAPEESATEIELELDPRLDDDTTISVLLRTAEDDQTVLRRQFEYAVERPEGDLTVSDQSETGESFVVNEATADAPFYLVVEYAGRSVQTEEFESDEPIEDYAIEFDEPIRTDMEVTTSLYAVEDDWELAAETVTYSFEPTGSLEASDQEGDGYTLTIEEASANVPFRVAAEYEDTTVESSTFAADERVEVELDLDPRLVEQTDVDLGVRAADDGETLSTETVTFTPESPEGPELTPEATIQLAEETFPLIGTPGAFESWFGDEAIVESHPDGYQVELQYLAARRFGFLVSNEAKTEAQTAAFAVDVFEQLFTSDYQILDVEIIGWLDSGTDEFGNQEYDRATRARMDRSTAEEVDWGYLKNAPAENLSETAERYRFRYIS